MYYSKKITLLAALSLILLQILPVKAQDSGQLRRDVEFLSGELCQGRAPGSLGGVEAASLISRRFSQYGLSPLSSGYAMSFRLDDGSIGRNIVGLHPGWGDRYVVVAAHFDNLGVLEGNIYPGADSNASGVAMLLGLVPELSCERYPQSIIFVALDAHQTMAGAQDLLERIDSGLLVNPSSGKTISRKNISLFLNLDMLGASISPLHEGRPDYLIALGADKHRNLLNRLNLDNLDLGFDYYGSPSFTDMFLNRVGDQRVFREAGVPVMLFTSGITMLTNKRDDDIDSLDFPVMEKRFKLLYHFLDHVLPIL